MSWLDDLRARLAEHEGELTPDNVCAMIATHWAGERVYIARRVGQPEIHPHDTPKTIQRRYNVSRSTAHAWMIRWRR